MALNLKDLVVKKDGGLTTGAKVGIGAAVAGLGLLLANNISKGNKQQGSVPSTATQPIVQPQPKPADNTGVQPQPEEKNNTLLYVGIGLGVLVVAGGIVYLANRK